MNLGFHFHEFRSHLHELGPKAHTTYMEVLLQVGKKLVINGHRQAVNSYASLSRHEL